MSAQAAGKWGDLLPRVASGLTMVVVALVAIWFGGLVFGLLLAAVCGLMVWELVRMLVPQNKGLAWQMGVLGAFAIGLALILPGVFTLPLLIAPSLVLAASLPGSRRIAAAYALLITTGAFALGWVRAEYGIGVLLWLVILVVISDVMGYFAGKSLGGPKFWPRVSPKKTWSGTIAGWVGAGCVGAVFAVGSGAMIAVVSGSVLLAFAGQMGDIAESAIKRRTGVKDSSDLIPGHGGVLDRFDGIIGAAAAFLLTSGLLGFPIAMPQ